MDLPCFHLSIPARDLMATRCWYERVLGCVAGRCSDKALILNLGGHQLVAQRHALEDEPTQPGIYPRHFGLVFDEFQAWDALRLRIEQLEEPFAVRPRVRFQGDVLEHHTFFLQDPSSNWIEFKYYCNPEAVLGCRDQAVVGDQAFRRT